MATRRTLTKKQKFDIQMIYRPMLKQNSLQYTNIADPDEETDLEIVDYLTIRIHHFSEITIEDVYSFIDEYENVLNWDDLVLYNVCWLYDVKYTGPQLIKMFLKKYDERLTPKHWFHISKLEDFYNQNDLIKKYKDKINWTEICRRKRLTPELLLEFKDYIDRETYFRRSRNCIDSRVLNQVFTYVKDHMEEVLTYKPKKSRKENESNREGNPTTKEV